MKIAFITGGARGIGAATVKKFIGEGWQVGFMDIDVEAAEDLVREIGNPNLLFVEGNICSREDVRQAVEKTVVKFGGITCVIANAGIHHHDMLLSISDDELDLMIDTNIKGTINTLREAVPVVMPEVGSVVINASVQSCIGKANSFAYGMTKGAIGQMAKSLAIDLGPRGIRVNGVCAGTIRTVLSENLFSRLSDINGCCEEELWQEELVACPLRRVGKPEEVAELIYFLASPAASYMTGGLYSVDGGYLAR